jgi:mono/diheme cytochrome c family protein
MVKKIVVGIVALIVAFALALQIVPYGRAHTNPPVQAEPKWNSPQTRELAQRACFDCHSNTTVWPWYSKVAPMSWLIQHDVDEGRSRLNFSEWNRPQREARNAARTVQRGAMPPFSYLILHPSARLSSEETLSLIQGLNASLTQQ